MIWWIVLGIWVLAVLVLVGSAVPLLRRLAGLRRAQQRLEKRTAEMQRRLEPALAALQQRTVELERLLQTTQERAELLQARRGEE